MRDAEFTSVQQEAGAVFDDARSDAPFAVHYGDPAAEYRAARSQSALIDFSDRTQIEMTGGDRASFLHNFCTNDVKALVNGSGCEAFVTNVKGRVLGHIFIEAGADSLCLETVAGAEEALMAHFDRYIITEDVSLHGRTSEWGELLLTGPAAAGLLQGVGFQVGPLPVYGHLNGQFANVDLSVRRIDLVGSSGYLMSMPREALADIWMRLSQAGARPAGAAAFESLRIEAVMPLYGVDISEENIAQEVGRTREAISFTKGCYLGQEPIARIDALGHVNRQLCGMRLGSGPVPDSGDSVFAAVSHEQKVIGRVTSATRSLKDDCPIALGYLKNQFIDPGTQVTVNSQGNPCPATVFGRATD